AMLRELAAALRAGAIAFSTSRSSNHATSDDRPVPSRLASWAEIRVLVDVMADLGTGIFEIANEQHPDPERQREYFDRLRDLAVVSALPIQIHVVSGSRDPYFPTRL